MLQTNHQYIAQDAFERWPLENDSVDLIVTSPPYPMVQMWDEIWSEECLRLINAGDGHEAYQAMHALLDKTWKESYRVLKPGGFACINIGDATRTLNQRFRIYHNHSRINNACHDIGFDTLPSVIWRKPTNAPNKFMGSGMLPAGAYVTMEHEYILIMRKEGKRSFKKDEKEIRSQSAMFWEERNKWFSDLWTDVIGTRQKMKMTTSRKRSAAYPLEIPLRLIHMYSQYGDVVVDPFSGTGTTTLAAITAGRSSIAFEKDKHLFEESLMTPTKREMKAWLNEFIEARVQNHIQYVSEKDMLFFRYKNDRLNLPVKTLQEKKLEIHSIKSINRKEETVTAKYKSLKNIL